MSAQDFLSRIARVNKRALVIASVMGLSLVAGGAAIAADCKPDYYDGLRAYEAGNRKEAINFWTQAGLSGNVLAQKHLGEIYENPQAGDGVLTDYIQSYKWYNLGANNDLQDCSGDFNNRSAANARDDSKEARDRLRDRMTIRQLEEAQTAFTSVYECKRSDRWLYRLGLAYQRGSGIPQSSLDACRYYELSSAMGNAAAKDALDVLHDVLKPEQLENCQREAKLWHPPGAEICTVNLGGEICKGGKNVPLQNIQASLRALHFYRGPINGRSSSATTEAIRDYQRSIKADARGTLTEPQVCMVIQQAADQGDARSQATLGEMYYQGVGKSRDTRNALSWLEKAANQNVGGALWRLGRIYVEGDGVEKDVALGCEDLRKADSRGHPGAAREIDRYCSANN